MPKTGSNIDDTTGEDGNLRKGVAWPNPRFTVNGDETVTDNLTGLVWTQDAYLTQDDWTGALDYVADMNAGTHQNYGYTDWRLPNVRELQSLVHYGVCDPAVPNTEGTGKCTGTGDPFINVQSYGYWSSTTYAGSTDGAWVVSMSSGVVGYGTKSDYYYVWPVRGGQ